MVFLLDGKIFMLLPLNLRKLTSRPIKIDLPTLKIQFFNPIVITMTQIAQMIVGVTMTFTSLKYVGTEGCWANLGNIQGTLVMYASYLFLFLQFFFKRYGIGIKKTNPKKKVQ